MARRGTRSPTFAAIAAQAKITRSESDEWGIIYFQRHKEDDKSRAVPSRAYLDAIPSQVRAHMRNVLAAVAKAPPTKFAGGGSWEAMHGEMTGYYEVRKKFNGHHYRLFCLLDIKSEGTGPVIALLTGMTKPDRTVFTDADYATVRELGKEYLKRNPRSVFKRT